MMNVERGVLFSKIESTPSALFPSSFDIRCSIFCGSLPLLPTAAAHGPFNLSNRKSQTSPPHLLQAIDQEGHNAVGHVVVVIESVAAGLGFQITLMEDSQRLEFHL